VAKRRNLMVDLATIIPVGKDMLLISLLAEAQEIKIFINKIYL
jgi:hypothetical protein